MSFEEGIVTKHRRMKEVVREVLKDFVRSRNDDNFLIVEVWRREGVPLSEGVGGVSIGPIRDPCELPSTETICRVRREIQNVNGEFLPTDPEVLFKRKVKMEVIRTYYGEGSSEYGSYLDVVYGVK